MSDKEFKINEAVVCEILQKSKKAQKLILTIANEAEQKNENTGFLPQLFNSHTDDSKEKYKKNIEELEEKLSDAEKRVKESEYKLESVNKKIENLESENKKLSSDCGKYLNLYNEVERELKNALNTISNLKDETDVLRNRISELENTLRDKEDEYDALNQTLIKTKEALRSLKNQFDKPIDFLAKYKALPDTIKNGLSNVIIETNVITFISSCSSEENLKALWEYTKDILNNKNNEKDLETLKDIFDYFFDIYNASLPEVKYLRDNVNIGDDLDDDIHVRGYGSMTSGSIKEIVLRGYKSKNTGRIICKSVVKA